MLPGQRVAWGSQRCGSIMRGDVDKKKMVRDIAIARFAKFC